MSNSSAFNTSMNSKYICIYFLSVNSNGVSLDKSRNDEHLTGNSRGWLNWLSLGMLGAGGTDDSSQFSGIVSDEVIQVSLLKSVASVEREKLFVESTILFYIYIYIYI